MDNKKTTDKDDAATIQAFYEEKLLVLAERLAVEQQADVGRAAAFAVAPHHGQKYNRLCGSRMTVGFWLQPAVAGDAVRLGRVLFQPESCLLGRVAAALCEQTLRGETWGGVKLLRQLLADLLAGRRDDLPAPYQPFACFAAVRYLQQRHSAILLPLDVILESWHNNSNGASDEKSNGIDNPQMESDR
ncbi:MAG: hypothetical protein ORN57_02325 [Alphaproteobacteria bacterium]|nr:hypothetical protein [Alphaproteobacteria bacterium]